MVKYFLTHSSSYPFYLFCYNIKLVLVYPENFISGLSVPTSNTPTYFPLTFCVATVCPGSSDTPEKYSNIFASEN